MAALLEDAQLDVVGLLETDLFHPISGSRDLCVRAMSDPHARRTQYISHKLGYYVDLGPSPQKHTWGAVLLSKFPILNSTHHLLPSPVGELAPAIYATLDVYGTEVDVVVAHNGQHEDALDRELQSRELARLLAARYPRPATLLGYFITRPHWKAPEPYEILTTHARMLDIEPSDLVRSERSLRPS